MIVVMQITVFGASGRVGSLVVAEALRRGYQVTAFVHGKNPFVANKNLRVFDGDIYDESEVAAALQGSQAVISCLGSWKTKRRDVLTTAMRHIIPRMQLQKITRIITLTGNGALAPAYKPGWLHRLVMAALAPFPAGKVFADGENHMRLLAASNLDYTTVRSPIMTSKRSTTYCLRLAKTGPALPTISRRAVVHCLLDQLTDTAYLRQTPIIGRSR